MHDALTTLGLVLLTLLAAFASVAAWLPQADMRLPRMLLWACGLGSVALFGYRALFAHQGWEPLQAHVDGLLLMSALVAATAAFLQAPSRVPGTTPFALPVLTLLLAWAICASSFTFEPFRIESVWNSVHLATVYIGTFFLAVAAVAGGMFLYAQRKLRRKESSGADTLGSLEAIETLIVRTSALGFAVLSLGLISGLIIVASGEDSRMGSGWWYSPKVVLAVTVWLIYALLVNVRHTTTFRGRRAAWLSIAGLVLLMVTFGIVNTMNAKGSIAHDPVVPTIQQEMP